MSCGREKGNKNVAAVLKFIGPNTPFELNLGDLRELFV